MLPIPRLLVEMPVIRKALIGIWNSYLRRFKPRYSLEQRMGATLLLDRTSRLDRALLVRGSWEDEQVATFFRMVRHHRAENRRSVFLDVGAHGALYSILAAKENL